MVRIGVIIAQFNIKSQENSSLCIVIIING